MQVQATNPMTGHMQPDAIGQCGGRAPHDPQLWGQGRQGFVGERIETHL